MLLRNIAPLDSVLHAHAEELGPDFDAYRNHAYRVVNLCVTLHPAAGEDLEKIAIAAAFHDLGIWTHRTFDYLQPSVDLACAHLTRAAQPHWRSQVATMIIEHHKLTHFRDNDLQLVEPFRRADWIDVSHGALSFGLRRQVLRAVFAAWPDAGFHKRLVKLSLRRLCTHPWNPLPFLKL